MTRVYCKRGYGICRPLPLYFYLRDVTMSNKFERDPVSLGFVFFFILIILSLQLLVEIKRRQVSREEQLVTKLAADAKRNLEAAQLQMQREMRQTRKNMLQSVSCSSVNFEALTEHTHQVGNNDALKVTRAVSLFGVLPSIMFIVTLSLENIDGLRPHGTTAFSLFSYGVIAPTVLFCYNSKMRKFAKTFITSEMRALICLKRNRQIQPIV